VAFSLNGQAQGVAFTDVLEGTYYPAASLYTMPEQTDGVTVAFNFGPDFAFPPPQVRVCTCVH
jgi:Set1/Ash2 histone methyltransferase complex subunit ASH2